MSNFIYLVFKCFLWAAFSFATIAIFSGVYDLVAHLTGTTSRPMPWVGYAVLTPSAMMSCYYAFWDDTGEKEAG